MSAAGSSSSRITTKRNKSAPETQVPHAASADAAHVVSIKKSRRQVAEPAAQEQFILAPSTDLKSSTEPFDARSILPRVKHAKNLSRLLQASSSAERRDDAALHRVSFECIDGLTRTYDREAEVLRSEDCNHKRIDREDVEVNMPSGGPMQGSQFVAFGVLAFPTKAKFNDICYDFVRTRRRCRLRERCPRIHPVDIQLYLPGAIQESQRVKQTRRGDSGLQPEPLAGTEPPPGTLPAEDGPMPRTDVVNSDKPTPPSSSTPMPPTAIRSSIQPRPATVEPSILADAQTLAQKKPTTPAVVTHPPDVIPPSSTSAQVEPAIPSTNHEPTVRVRLPPPLSPSSPSPSVQLSSARTDPPPRHRLAHPLPPKPSWLDDVQHWHSVSGLQDLPNSRYTGVSSEESHSSTDSDEERVAICRRIASPDPFPLENWDPRADESAWSDSNVTDDPPQSKRVSAGREILASSASRNSLSPTNLILPSYASKPLAEMKKFLHGEQQVIRRPRPRTNERCRRWLRDMCDKGYECRYIHDDLDYMDDPVVPPVSGVHAPLKGAVLAHLTSQPERTFVRRPPETVGRVVHQHIHAKFGSGFQVTELDTGFESPWIFVSGFPDHLTDFKIETLLRRFGDVTEIRRPAQPVSPLSVKVHFSKVSEAFTAFTSLNGAVEYGRTLETRMAVENKKSGTIFKDTAVRIDWEGPNRNVYMGYADLEKAQHAVQLARKKPYGEYQPTAALHYALPAVGKVTVKFTGVPPDVTEKGMEIYGEHQGMVTERPNYTGSSIDETIVCVKRLLTNFRSKMVDFEIKNAPYREGKMRVWAIFSSPKDAEAAAQHLHNRKPATMGYTRVMARHMKSISFSLSVAKACKVGAEIKAFTENIWRQGPGYSLSNQDRGTFVSVRLCGED
ncbi:unnamed protein product [Cyclocybe aegerita]|uniref:Uncharacterized protein n=1 Tax=Cyclocybe aegerita TaxID=1973307 RepID=A0A8S0VQ17_CYCAE|nr:unnamed protein product [Cyclocybe aegerita]